MEKRFLLAFILSFMILYIWGALFAPKSMKSQPIINKEFTAEPALSPQEKFPVASAKSNQEKPIVKLIDKRYTIENSHLVLEFSSIGGNLVNNKIKKYDQSLPITNILSLGNSNAEYAVSEITDSKIVFVADQSGLKIKKSFELIPDDYLLKSSISIEKIGKNDMSNEELELFILDINRLDNIGQMEKMLYEYSVSKNDGIYRKKNAFKFTAKENIIEKSNVNWVGFRDQYFAFIIKPINFIISNYSINYLDEKSLGVKSVLENAASVSRETKNFEFLIFIGPQDLFLLKNYKIGIDDIINYNIGGFFDFMSFGLTDIIAKTILIYFNFVHKIIPNWGICIILLGISIFLFTSPLTYKSTISMKKMQFYQPEIKKIQDKNKNNPQKLNKELGEFFKENKINPLSGCLPLIFQMPIFIGLYQLLWRSVYFNKSSFLWIEDLSKPDRLFKLSFSLPFIGEYINILPIIYMIVMLINQKFTSQSMVVSDPSQKAQQKFMGLFMSVFLGFIFYKFSSGLLIYFIVYYMLTVIMQMKFLKITPTSVSA